jgi:hypothetical protein
LFDAEHCVRTIAKRSPRLTASLNGLKALLIDSTYDLAPVAS